MGTSWGGSAAQLPTVSEVAAGRQRLGPRHLAAAVGTATVAVYWCVSLGSYGPLYRARHRTPTAWRLHCPVCGANGLQHDCRSSHHASFVADVTVDEVLAEALDLLTTEITRASTG